MSFVHNDLSSPEKKDEKVCKFYKSYGFCRYLDRCRYSHSLDAISPVTRNVEGRRDHTNRRTSPTKGLYKRWYPRRHFHPDSKKVNISSHKSTYPNPDVLAEAKDTNSEEIDNRTELDESETQKRASTTVTYRGRSTRGIGRWNVRRPRYFYGNFRLRHREQKIKFSDGKDDNSKLNNAVNNSESTENQQQDSVAADGIDNAQCVNSTKKPYQALRKQLVKMNELCEDDYLNMFQTEIQQLQKRFPAHQVLDSINHVYQIEYFPTDPDWSFQVNSIDLHIAFPSEYPRVPFSVMVLNPNHCLPELLVKHLNRSINNWLSERFGINERNGNTEIMFRPFLRWLDKNLEEMFLNGLRLVKQDIDTIAAGIEFIPYENLYNPESKEISASSDEDVLLTDKTDSNNSENINETNISDNSVANIQLTEADIPCANPDFDESDVVGISRLSIDEKQSNAHISDQTHASNISGSRTEVKFRDLYLSENTGTLTCQKLQILIQCIRCKTRHDLTTTGNKSNHATCTKCHQVQEISFQPSLLHPNSSVVGYLHLSYCQIVDLPLVHCEFVITCLNCAKQSQLTGIHYGQQHLTWCRYCNRKMSISIQSVRFLELQSSGIHEKLQHQNVKLENKFIKNTVLAVQPGKPLPDNGTCKHFKKSFRWLRFPCCGKAYPCDICHDEKEDHEMKYANRMICGFCAREQPYTKDKECIFCNSYTTKKSGAHWEGGKGCRDKIKMSKTDKHKYSGTQKTTRVKKISAKLLNAV